MPSSFIRLQDIADILIMTFLLYQLFSWFRGTRAVQVLLGLGIVTLIYFLTRYFGLYMTSWVLEELGTVLIILIIVVFQAEIRQALYRFSLLRHLFNGKDEVPRVHFQEIAETLFSMADRRIGAIIAIERTESISELMLNGVHLDCEISPQILETIFTGGTPLHDGAVLIKNNRIAMASCHLPLSINPSIPQYLGTRHRAGIGLSERSDAVLIIVSEERGEVSLAVNGEIRRIKAVDELIAILDDLIHTTQERLTLSLRQKLLNNLVPKAAIFLIVTASWLAVTIRQSQIITVTAPVLLNGIPEGLMLIKSSPDAVEVQLKSFSGLAPAPAKLELAANIDISSVSRGESVLRIKNSDFNLPAGMTVNTVTPQFVKIITEKKSRKTVPVRAKLKNTSAFKGKNRFTLKPDTVQIEGPYSQISRIGFIETEEIDVTKLSKEKEYTKMLIHPKSELVTVSKDSVQFSFGSINK